MKTLSRSSLLLRGTLLVSLLALPLPAQALTKEIVDEKVEVRNEKPEGWYGTLKLGVNISLSSTDNVVGAQDGTSFSLGANIGGTLDYLRAGHEWRNILEISEGYTKTPNISRFIKSTDYLTFESIYLFHFERFPWLGPFVRFGLRTALLPGYDVRDADYNYNLTKIDGTTVTGFATSKDTLHLTDAFMPLQLKESIGAYGKPVNNPAYALEIRLGLGSQQIFADGGYAVSKVDTTTKAITLKELETYAQVGGELALLFNGTLYEDKIIYRLTAEALIPFYNSGTNLEDKNALELTNLEFGAGLTFKVFSWASVVYEFKAVRTPQLLDDFQIQNNLLLSFSYTLSKAPEAKPAAATETTPAAAK